MEKLSHFFRESKPKRLFMGVVKEGEKYFITLGDHRVSGPLDEVMTPWSTSYDSLEASPDRQRLACVARKGQECFVFLDGQQLGDNYDYIDYRSLRFSPDSQKLAWVAGKNRESFIVINGQRLSEGYDFVFPWLYFSPDSQKVAWIAAKNGQEFAVLHGQRMGESHDWFDYNDVPPTDNASMIVRELASAFATNISHLRFSPNSQKLVWVASRYEREEGHKYWVVINGQKISPEYRFISQDVVFSPDSKKLIFVVYKEKFGEDSFAVVYDLESDIYKEIGPYESISTYENLTFSPDGQHYAFVGRKLVTHGEEREPREVVVLDGQEISRDYREGVKNLVFTPTDHLLWITEKVIKQGEFYDKKEKFVVVHNSQGEQKTLGPYAGIYSDRPPYKVFRFFGAEIIDLDYLLRFLKWHGKAFVYFYAQERENDKRASWHTAVLE